MSRNGQAVPLSSRSGLSWLDMIVIVGVLVVLAALLLPPIDQPRGEARRSQCKNNLKQIMLALHNYHDMYDSFPPAYVPGEDGRPWHSWRVLILPFLDCNSLYHEYDFSQPWDSPHNAKLGEQVPPVYRCPASEGSGVSYVAIIGERTVWPGEQALRIRDITDGTANTLAVVEVADSGIHWMEPRDLMFDQLVLQLNQSRDSGMSSDHKKGIHAAFADGAVRFLGDDTGPDVLRRLILRDDGEFCGEF